MWRRVLLLTLLLAGCAQGPETREMNLYPTPDFRPTESAQYYFTALAHYRAQEREETRIFAKLAMQMFEQEKAEPRQIRLARELYARALAETGKKAQALVEYQKLAQQYPKVPSYQKALQDLR